MNRRSFFLNGITALVAGVASPWLAESIARPAKAATCPPRSDEYLAVGKIRYRKWPNGEPIEVGPHRLIHTYWDFKDGPVGKYFADIYIP